jgi:hypothetical protein
MRAGHFIKQGEGYNTFIPAPLQEITGWQRNRRFIYAPYMALFVSSVAPGQTSEEVAVQTTRSEQQEN